MRRVVEFSKLTVPIFLQRRRQCSKTNSPPHFFKLQALIHLMFLLETNTRTLDTTRLPTPSNPTRTNTRENNECVRVMVIKPKASQEVLSHHCFRQPTKMLSNKWQRIETKSTNPKMQGDITKSCPRLQTLHCRKKEGSQFNPSVLWWSPEKIKIRRKLIKEINLSRSISCLIRCIKNLTILYDFFINWKQKYHMKTQHAANKKMQTVQHLYKLRVIQIIQHIWRVTRLLKEVQNTTFLKSKKLNEITLAWLMLLSRRGYPI